MDEHAEDGPYRTDPDGREHTPDCNGTQPCPRCLLESVPTRDLQGLYRAMLSPGTDVSPETEAAREEVGVELDRRSEEFNTELDRRRAAEPPGQTRMGQRLRRYAAEVGVELDERRAHRAADRSPDCPSCGPFGGHGEVPCPGCHPA